MSQAESTDDELSRPSPAALRDTRWLTGAVWGALLLALVVTSGYGITAFAQGSVASRYIGLPLNADDSNEKAASVVGLALSGAAAALVVLAWAAFAQATNRLVSALADSSDGPEDAPVAMDWLVERGGGNLVTMAGGVVQFLGMAWGVMIVTPAVLALVTAFS